MISALFLWLYLQPDAGPPTKYWLLMTVRLTIAGISFRVLRAIIRTCKRMPMDETWALKASIAAALELVRCDDSVLGRSLLSPAAEVFSSAT